MAAPTIPPIRLGLIGTEGVLAGSSSERRVTRGSSDATTHTTVISSSASFAA